MSLPVPAQAANLINSPLARAEGAGPTGYLFLTWAYCPISHIGKIWMRYGTAAAGFEGIGSKRWDLPYRSGRVKHWIKIKKPLCGSAWAECLPTGLGHLQAP